MSRRSNIAVAVITAAFAVSALAQTGAPLPPNYKVILDNDDVQVQRVHYGPHESVPMHDHPAVSTIYVYLNSSGIVDILHEKGFTLHRPPTHTGAFRVSPGAFERHAIQNTSDLPSDFLRIELKRIPVKGLPAEFRGQAPQEPITPGTEVLYTNNLLRVERTLCMPADKCRLAPEASPSALVMIALNSTIPPAQNPVVWLPAKTDLNVNDTNTGSNTLEVLRIVLPQH